MRLLSLLCLAKPKNVLLKPNLRGLVYVNNRINAMFVSHYRALNDHYVVFFHHN
jgi:hypothetical protein